MKKFLVVLISALALTGIMLSGAEAQMLYNGIYWVDGKVLAPTNDPTITINGRDVVVYPATTDAWWADDTSGTTGRSGRNGEFMVNTLADWRTTLTPGSYNIATVTGADNYGANPISLTISGNGWDTSPDLQLTLGGGIGKPKERGVPSWLLAEIPVVKSVWFDGKLYQKKLVEGASKLKYVVSNQPKISVQVTAANIGIDKNTLAVVMDEGAAVTKTYTLSQFSDYSEVLGPQLPKEIDFSVNLKSLGDTIPDGDHAFKFYAGNSVGTTDEVASVSVMGGPVSVIGIPINNPSPLHLASQSSVIFQYGLSKDANIDIFLFDITGQVVKKFAFVAGTVGGQAGGSANPNKVVWDLTTDQGTRLAAGIYLWEIVDHDNKKVIGKGKLAAAP